MTVEGAGLLGAQLHNMSYDSSLGLTALTFANLANVHWPH